MTSQTHEVSFDVTVAEDTLIRKVAARARRIDQSVNGSRARSLLDWRMDFTACHANGMPLKLGELLTTDEFNFIHDAFGIARHLDRDTGKLGNCFVPRFAQPEGETVGSAG